MVLAQAGDTRIVYLSIYLRDQEASRLVGQIFLHDYDRERQESLIGYHLFQPQDLGHGLGIIELQLLIHYVQSQTAIRRLTIITDTENRASQRIAEKCGFVYTGPAHEGLPLICYEWRRPP